MTKMIASALFTLLLASSSFGASINRGLGQSEGLHHHHHERGFANYKHGIYHPNGDYKHNMIPAHYGVPGHGAQGSSVSQGTATAPESTVSQQAAPEPQPEVVVVTVTVTAPTVWVTETVDGNEESATTSTTTSTVFGTLTVTVTSTTTTPAPASSVAPSPVESVSSDGVASTVEVASSVEVAPTNEPEPAPAPASSAPAEEVQATTVVSAAPASSAAAATEASSSAVQASASPVPVPNSGGAKAAAPSQQASGTFPFTQIVAFGDDLTDNAQGSYAHGITGNEVTGEGKLMWGNGTFTDGQVAVSYMSQALNIPLTVDYAFGSADGAEYLGSVCDTALVAPSQIASYAKLRNGNTVPSALQQVSNYTNGPFANNIDKTLHFLWTGNNDVEASVGWVGRFTICTDHLCDPSQQKFIQGMSACFNSTLNNLVNRGAKYIMVPSIYPRSLTPWTNIWITQNQALVDNYDQVINTVNDNIKAAIEDMNASRGTSIKFYDANAWIKKALKDSSVSKVAGANNGFTNTCVDGCVIQNPTGVSNWDMFWKNTVTNHQPDDFFWMTEVVPSTTVMKSLGNDMSAFIAAQQW